MAYLFSFLGCLLGLKATDRARLATSTAMRTRWLILASWAIGGTGIWVMHFVAIMAVAVCSMHCTGMYALSVSTTTTPRSLTGVVPFTLLVPIFAFVLVVVVALGYGMLNSPSERDAAELDELQNRITTQANV